MNYYIDIEKQVLNLLETYRERKKRIAVLHYELNHPAKVSITEQIEIMVYEHGDGVGSVKNSISDKTNYTALNYKEQAERTNWEMINTIEAELSILEQRQNKLNYYVGLLDERQADIIRLVYLEKVSKTDIAKQYDRTRRTIDRIQKKAIKELVKLYEYSESFEERSDVWM